MTSYGLYEWFLQLESHLTFGKFSVARKPIINGGAIRPGGLLFTWRQFSQKLFDNFSLYAGTFTRRVLMNCQKMDLIESL